MSRLPDVREMILVRLHELAALIVGDPARAFRNRLRIPDELLKAGPALSILDGDELPDDSAYGRGRPANTPVKVMMTPEIYGFCESTKEVDVGSVLNDLRRALIKAIMNDPTLINLCDNGDIRYTGFSTGLAAGRSLEGEMAVGFAFYYYLRPMGL